MKYNVINNSQDARDRIHRVLPRPDRIREVVKAIVEAREDGEFLNMVSMTDSARPTSEFCGCHAGELWIGMDGLGISTVGVHFCYRTAARDFAKYVLCLHGDPDEGDSKELLQEWALKNPDLWGNDWGASMFCAGDAFGYGKTCFPPKVITDHWLAVADRIEAHENDLCDQAWDSRMGISDDD